MTFRAPGRALRPLRTCLMTPAVVVILSVAAPAAAQTGVARDALTDYARLLQRVPTVMRSDSVLARPSFMILPQSGAPGAGSISEGLRVDHRGPGPHPWAARLPARNGDSGVVEETGFAVGATGARLRTFVNTEYASGRNDGTVWAGRGLTTAVDAGVRARLGRVVLQLEPTVWWSQNASFEMAGLTRGLNRPRWGYPWSDRIDYPQRLGPDALTEAGWGQSYVALELGGFEAGFGTRNMWWGPGVESALIMSDNAAGFPHGFLGTRRPVEIGIGTLEAMWVWGRLASSGWSSEESDERARFFTGAALVYSPRWIRGLSLGASRVFQRYVPDGGLDVSEYFLVVQGVQKVGFATANNPTGEDEHDQLGSLFARWVFPASGLELYAEWARNDHSWDVRDLLTEPEHSQAYILGLQKAWPLVRNRLLNLRVELIHIEQAMTFRARSNGSYYLHHIVQQGYTHEGQLLGAQVGPGGKEQYLGIDLYTPTGVTSFYLRREVLNNDAYYAQFAPDLGFCCHDVPLTFGTDAMRFVGDDGFEVAGGLALTRRLNRYYDYKNDVWNLNLNLSATWRPS